MEDYENELQEGQQQINQLKEKNEELEIKLEIAEESIEMYKKETPMELQKKIKEQIIK